MLKKIARAPKQNVLEHIPSTASATAEGGSAGACFGFQEALNSAGFNQASLHRDLDHHNSHPRKSA